MGDTQREEEGLWGQMSVSLMQFIDVRPVQLCKRDQSLRSAIEKGIESSLKDLGNVTEGS